MRGVVRRGASTKAWEQRNKRKRSPEPSDDPIDAAVDSMDFNRPSKRSAVPSSGNPDKPEGLGPEVEAGAATEGVGGAGEGGGVEEGLQGEDGGAEGGDKGEQGREERKREEREKRKQENVLKSGTKFQVISNPKTLKKIQKTKQRKLLRQVPDEVVNKNNKKEEVVVEEK
ncbi:hypothetical protein QJS10_CPB04g01448 [Acorus calamus]|uniref:Coiled-coil domain-containing protein 86 n=1 Tax=Acorus calamus TaxID=4465 RepID=A0AAV9F1M4_ACOCL|nr:hypothetical protein QJS10_CPB04g01448 [Acorus calamus]